MGWSLEIVSRLLSSVRWSCDRNILVGFPSLSFVKVYDWSRTKKGKTERENFKERHDVLSKENLETCGPLVQCDSWCHFITISLWLRKLKVNSISPALHFLVQGLSRDIPWVSFQMNIKSRVSRTESQWTFYFGWCRSVVTLIVFLRRDRPYDTYWMTHTSVPNRDSSHQSFTDSVTLRNSHNSDQCHLNREMGYYVMFLIVVKYKTVHLYRYRMNLSLKPVKLFPETFHSTKRSMSPNLELSTL